MTRETDEQGPRRITEQAGIEVTSPSPQLVLTCLERRGGTRSLIRLAHDIATHYYGPGPSPARVRRVYRHLYDDHLQKLVATGLVEYSAQDGSVSLVGPQNSS